MAKKITFTILKPDAIEKNYTGAILHKINQAGFNIISIKKTQLSKKDARKFYKIHKKQPFFAELVKYMTSGPIIAAILEKENAVQDFRKLIGSTDPAEAEKGTIRKDFAESKAKNAVHGSDSDRNAMVEGNFFFSEREKF